VTQGGIQQQDSAAVYFHQKRKIYFVGGIEPQPMGPKRCWAPQKILSAKSIGILSLSIKPTSHFPLTFGTDFIFIFVSIIYEFVAQRPLESELHKTNERTIQKHCSMTSLFPLLVALVSSLPPQGPLRARGRRGVAPVPYGLASGPWPQAAAPL